MRKIKIMLSAWCLVASGQWLVASAVLPTLGVRAPYVGGSGSLRWRFGLPTLEGRSPCVGAARSVIARRSGRGRPPGGPEVGRGKQQAYNNKVLVGTWIEVCPRCYGAGWAYQLDRKSVRKRSGSKRRVTVSNAWPLMYLSFCGAAIWSSAAASRSRTANRA